MSRRAVSAKRASEREYVDAFAQRVGLTRVHEAVLRAIFAAEARDGRGLTYGEVSDVAQREAERLYSAGHYMQRAANARDRLYQLGYVVNHVDREHRWRLTDLGRGVLRQLDMQRQHREATA